MRWEYILRWLIEVDRYCAEKYYFAFREKSFFSRLATDVRLVKNVFPPMVRSEFRQAGSLDEYQEVFRRAREDAAGYRKAIESGKLSGEKADIEAHRVFSQYAEGLNVLTNTFGKGPEMKWQ